jgi:hypothetical protein
MNMSGPNPNDSQSQKTPQDGSQEKEKLSLGEIVGALIIGILFDVFSFPNFVINTGKTLGWDWMQIGTYLIPFIQHDIAVGGGIASILAGKTSLSTSILIFFLFVAILVLCLIGLNGGLVIDQVRGAFTAGNQKRGITMGAIAIGASLAFILVETNLANNVWLFPPGVQTFIIDNFHQTSPIPDTLLTLIIVAISFGSVLSNVPKLRAEPSFDQLRSSIWMTFMGTILGFLESILQTLPDQTDHPHPHE